MNERKDYVKEFLEWLRGNRLIAFIIVLGIVITAILNFKDVVQGALFPDECPEVISQNEKEMGVLKEALAKGVENSDIILISNALKGITSNHLKAENLKCKQAIHREAETSKAQLFAYLESKSKYWQANTTPQQKTELNQLLTIALKFIQDNHLGDENDSNLLHSLIAITSE